MTITNRQKGYFNDMFKLKFKLITIYHLQFAMKIL